MTVTNSSFPGPFIISTFEIRALKLEKLVVYHFDIGNLSRSAFGPGKQNSGLVNFAQDLRLAQIGSTYKETASGA